MDVYNVWLSGYAIVITAANGEQRVIGPFPDRDETKRFVAAVMEMGNTYELVPCNTPMKEKKP